MSTRNDKPEPRSVVAERAPDKRARGRRSAAPVTGTVVTVQTFFADELAMLAASERHRTSATPRCDTCEAPLDAEAAAGSGLFVWARGDEVRIEEPLLCERCATTFGVVMNGKLDVEDEEG